MAEFCKECAEKTLGFSGKELERAVFSTTDELCEGCGQYKPVLVSLRPSLVDKIKNIFRKRV